MKKLVQLFFLISSTVVFAQSKIEWNEGVVLKLSDFGSNTTKIGGVTHASIQLPGALRYGVEMNSAQFMFTKNFNAMVSVEFDPNTASIIAPNEEIALNLVNFANYQFNLSELYARKLRKALHEQKKLGSSVSYIQSVYNEVEKAYTERLNTASTKTNMGLEGDEILTLNDEVLKEIMQLPDFCKSCKIDKKQKN